MHAKLALLGGEAIVVGGLHPDVSLASERCAFDSNACAQTGSIPVRAPDSEFSLVRVDAESLLLVSFYGIAHYSGSTNEWTMRAAPAFSRASSQGVAALAGGEVLLLSMSPYELPQPPEVYDYELDEWVLTLPQPEQTWDGNVITLLDGRILVTSSSSGAQLYERR